MATFVNAGHLGQGKRVSADGGDALTTSTTYHIFPDNIRYFDIEGNNFSAATVEIEMAKQPYAVVLFTQDDFVTAPSELSVDLQGVAAGAVAIDAMDTEANGDFIYVGSHVKFKGIRVLMVDAQVNANASVMTVRYWDGSSLTDISDTDGTISGGATFAQDGDITWTVPSDWVKGRLTDLESFSQPQQNVVPFANHYMYWTKIEVSATLSASVDLENFFLLSNETPVQFRSAREMAIRKTYKGYSGLALATSSGTVTVAINAHGLNSNSELE